MTIFYICLVLQKSKMYGGHTSTVEDLDSSFSLFFSDSDVSYWSLLSYNRNEIQGI